MTKGNMGWDCEILNRMDGIRLTCVITGGICKGVMDQRVWIYPQY